jgi:hypothetical protein
MASPGSSMLQRGSAKVISEGSVAMEGPRKPQEIAWKTNNDVTMM